APARGRAGARAQVGCRRDLLYQQYRPRLSVRGSWRSRLPQGEGARIGLRAPDGLVHGGCASVRARTRPCGRPALMTTLLAAADRRQYSAGGMVGTEIV